MRTFSEWCEFFAAVERDPAAKITGFTIRDMLAARAHVAECARCKESSDRTLAKAPPEDPKEKFHRAHKN